MTPIQSHQCNQVFGKVITLAGVLCASILGSQEAAFSAGFVRRDSDADNSFYEIIDEFQQFANIESQALNLSQVGARALDPEKLTLQYDHEVVIFFLNEGAGYRNQLGTIATGTTEFETMVFNDITCVEDCSYTGYRSPYDVFGTPDGEPLAIGDYYSLGLIEAGTSLDFFLRRDGFNRTSTDVWYTDAALNSDGLQHVMAYEFQNYLVLAWEDLKGGGDRDYNDVVFAIDFGDANLEYLESVKIPESAFSVMGYVVVGFAGIFLSRSHACSRP